MSKPTLTPDNVNAVTAAINDLDDSSILIEAEEVSEDFTIWLKSKFDLTAEQLDYVNGYPEKVKKFYGHLFAAGFLNRSSITFAAPPDNPTTPRRTKETRANLFGNISYNNSDKDLEGPFEINIEFSLLD